MQYTVRDVLSMEVAPALGCTEPIAVALAAASAAELLPSREIASIDVLVDPNIYKNGMGVSIPAAHPGKGLDLAAAIGALAGDANARLEVLGKVDETAFILARDLVAQGLVTVRHRNERGLYVDARVSDVGGGSARAVIQGRHDAVVLRQCNGRTMPDGKGRADSGDAPAREKTVSPAEDMRIWLAHRSIGDLIALLDGLADADYEFLRRGVDMNMALSTYGLKHDCGLGVGRTLERLAASGRIARDAGTEAKIMAAAAADARLAGAPLPAMSSAGSGTQGLGAVLIIWAVRKRLGACDDRAALRATALSHLVTSSLKARIGRLSAMCGCAIAAGAGAAAGVAYMLGGDVEAVGGAVKNVTADLAGVICDGAKSACALKLASAAGSAVQSALFALEGVVVGQNDGIVSASPEATMDALGRLSNEGMTTTDQVILDIMCSK